MCCQLENDYLYHVCAHITMTFFYVFGNFHGDAWWYGFPSVSATTNPQNMSSDVPSQPSLLLLSNTFPLECGIHLKNCCMKLVISLPAMGNDLIFVPINWLSTRGVICVSPSPLSTTIPVSEPEPQCPLSQDSLCPKIREQDLLRPAWCNDCAGKSGHQNLHSE